MSNRGGIGRPALCDVNRAAGAALGDRRLLIIRRVQRDLGYSCHVAAAGLGYGRRQLSAICGVLADGRGLRAAVLGSGRGYLRANAADLGHGDGAVGGSGAITVDALIDLRGVGGAGVDRLVDGNAVSAAALKQAGRVALTRALGESRTGGKGQERCGGDK